MNKLTLWIRVVILWESVKFALGFRSTLGRVFALQHEQLCQQHERIQELKTLLNQGVYLTQADCDEVAFQTRFHHCGAL